MRHFNNKNKCKNIFLDVDYDVMINEYDKYYSIYLKILNEKEENDKIYGCEYCNKKFKYKNSYYDHRKNRCKEKKEKDRINAELNEKFLELKLELKRKNEKFEKENQELKNEIKILKEKLTTQCDNGVNQDFNINNANNCIQQVTNGNQKINNNKTINNNSTTNDNKIVNNGTIIINNYGEEDLSQMGIEDWKSLFACEWKMIPKLTEKMHIENEKGRNIYIPSLKDKHLMILKNQKWILVDRKSFIKELIFKKNEIFLEIMDKYKKEFNDVDLKRKIGILNMCLSEDEIDDLEREETISGVQLALYHGKHLVKNSYEKGYNKKLKVGE